MPVLSLLASPLVVLSLLLVSQAAAAEPEANLADYYGFDPVEVYDGDDRLFRLVAGDFGGDDQTDLAAVDNGGSQIKLWIQSDEPSEGKESDGTANAYLLPGRFTEEKLLVDRAITSLDVGDFDGDGQADFATIEDGDLVQVRLQRDGRFRDQPPIRLADLGTDPLDLAAGDLDGDGQDDLVALGIETTYVLLADEDGRFADPIRIPNTSDDLDFAALVDLDGDDRRDLFYAAFGEAGYTACIRLQQNGRLGAELRMEESDLRAIALADCDDWPGAELVTIDDSTGRVKIQKLQRRQDDAGRRLAQIGLGGKERTERGWAVADLDGDKTPEVVVSDPDGAELLLLRAGRNGLSPAERFPSLVDITAVAAVPKGRIDPRDMMGREQRTLLVLSEEEETIATVDYADGKLTLPRPVSIDGVPVAVAAAGEAAIALVRTGKSRSTEYKFLRLEPGEDDTWTADPIAADEDDLELGGLDVTSMQVADFDRDGRSDLLLTVKRKPAVVLFGADTGDDENGGDAAAFERRDSSGFALPPLEPAQVSVRDAGLLVSQGRYARRLVWQDGGWQVAEQINAPSSGARVDLLRLAAGGNEGDAAIVDNAADRLYLTAADGSLRDEIELGDLAVQDLLAADVDGDRQPDLLLLAGGRIGVLGSRSDRRELQTVATYEREDDDAYFADVVAADFNADGLTDLVVNETAEHTLEIAAIAPDPTEILRADRFKLFEQKSFQGDRASGTEPREMIAADVTGDGRTDLVLLMDERLLVFPQDAPE